MDDFLDKEGFIENIKKCTPILYKMGKVILKNDEDIGDAIQETILTGYEKIKTLKDEKYFKTWIVRIFINKCNLMLKKKKKTISIDEVYDIGYKDKRIESLEIKEAVESLKEDYKVVITLYYIIGFSIKEICSILNEKEGTIKSRLCRGRNSLRSFFDNREENCL